jgi:hypothetical protein
MNKRKANERAQELWGPMALAWIVARVKYVSNDTTSRYGAGWRTFKGCGKTWEAAFADADKRRDNEVVVTTIEE